MPLYNYIARAQWAGNRKQPKQIGDDILRMVAAVDKTYAPPAGCNTAYWFVPDIDGSYYPAKLSEYIHDFTNYVEHNMCIYEGEPDPMGGYVIFFGLGIEPESAEKDGILKIIVRDGSPAKNNFEFQVGEYTIPPAPDRINFSFYKDALLGGVSIWPADWANVACFLSGSTPAEACVDPTFPYSHFQMPWMSYLSAERAAKVSVPAAIVTERTAHGGLLMIAAETRLDPQNPEHMKRSRVLAEIMIEHAGESARAPS
jgi:hypothetical protein